MKLRIPVSEKDQSEGDEAAFLVLVEYGDYQCPHCRAAFPIVKRLQTHFGKDLRFIFRNFPLGEIHPFAMSAAVVAEACALQKKFWPIHDIIYREQDLLSTAQLFTWAEGLGVDLKKLENDIHSSQVTSKVKTDFEGGIRSGVNGTPSFFINGQRYDGDYSFDHLRIALETILTQK
jgi:protein-disulfide isomerase